MVIKIIMRIIGIVIGIFISLAFARAFIIGDMKTAFVFLLLLWLIDRYNFREKLNSYEAQIRKMNEIIYRVDITLRRGLREGKESTTSA